MSNCGCGNITLPTGADGLNGLNAFTITTVTYVQPIIGNTVVVQVSNDGQFTGAWAAPTQRIWIENGGYYSVVASTPTTITVLNLGYTGSVVGGVSVLAGQQVSPSGVKGDIGANGANGVAVLELDFAHSADVNSTANYTAVKTATIPAGFFVANGDGVEIEAQIVSNLLIGGRGNIEITLFDGTVTRNVTDATFDFINNAAWNSAKVRFIVGASNVGAGILTPRNESVNGKTSVGGYAAATTALNLDTTVMSPIRAFRNYAALGAMDFTQPIIITLSLQVINAGDKMKAAFWKVIKLKK